MISVQVEGQKCPRPRPPDFWVMSLRGAVEEKLVFMTHFGFVLGRRLLAAGLELSVREIRGVGR